MIGLLVNVMVSETQNLTSSDANKNYEEKYCNRPF